MADVASKQQTTVLYLSTTVTLTRRHTELIKKLTNLMRNLFCPNEHPVQFFVQFFTQLNCTECTGPCTGLRMRFVSYPQGNLRPIYPYSKPLYQTTKRPVREGYNPPPAVPILIHLYLYMHSPPHFFMTSFLINYRQQFAFT